MHGGQIHLHSNPTGDRDRRQLKMKMSADSQPQLGLDSEVDSSEVDSSEVDSDTLLHEFNGLEQVPTVARSSHVMHNNDAAGMLALEVTADAHMRHPRVDDVDASEDPYAGLDYDSIVFGAAAGDLRKGDIDDHMAWEGGKPRALQHRRGPHGKRSAAPPHLRVHCTARGTATISTMHACESLKLLSYLHRTASHLQCCRVCAFAHM